jgi:cytochrome c-type biogenesis protein CcmF
LISTIFADLHLLGPMGRGFVLLALLFASVGFGAGLAGGFLKNAEATRIARWCAIAFAATSILANLVMVGALVTDDFSVGYVAEVGSIATPLYFKIPSLWASLSGSILFWAGVLGIYVGLYARKARPAHAETQPWTLAALLGTAVFFTALVSSVADPFHSVYPVPLDGPGPNPLLQNHWLMAIHPPMLYLGYVGMSVPFSMAIGSLCAGRLEAGWLAPLRRWLLVPWVFLTVGIMLGGWWSYGVLGWGGYWAWDPVENASFHPWLTATAAIHSAMVTERKGLLKTWTLVLIITSFLLTLFGTFLTRSGVFNSVHSFTQSDIGPVFLVAIGVIFTGTVVLLALRDHKLKTGRGFAKQVGNMKLLSRETAILAQNLLFTVFTATVLLGTIFPLLAEAVNGDKLSVGAPYFDRVALPIGIMLVTLMGVGPALPWGEMNPRRALRRFVGPIVGGALVALAAALAGFTGPESLLAMFVCGFALVSNVGEYATPVMARMRVKKERLDVAARRAFVRGRRRFGGHLAHLGIIIAVMAIALSKGYRTTVDLTLREGETAQVEGYDITFTGADLIQLEYMESLTANFAVTRNGRDLGIYSPAMNFYPRQREPIGSPAVRSTPAEDLYLSLVQVQPDGDWAAVRVLVMPAGWWLWACLPVFVLSIVVIVWPAKKRKTAAELMEKAA